ncbi:hypothetical protein BA768_09170 [Chryseobacterium sp. CBo1]|uniref:RDD family protein n=1 Tax=Chryseobacterium sp. CBo1 TaxID=1869230 RepID=UPI000810DAF5|nr:RDD family protein [Chryseobacterium sp. CBo1]OCK49525.1 hypothetical protein BA768_09170 [Chryseobacterium sp. CBo1]
MKKISELKIKKIIHRPTQNFDEEGKRIYNAFEYDLSYNPTHIGNERERLYAKIIDLLPFFLLFQLGFHMIFFASLLLSILSVLVIGTFTESTLGTTVGKKFFKLKVIDDFGKNPKILKSALRNFLSFINFFPVFSDFEPGPNEYWAKSGTRLNFSMHLNNQIAKTFIVKEDKIPEIKKLLAEKK